MSSAGQTESRRVERVSHASDPAPSLEEIELRHVEDGEIDPRPQPDETETALADAAKMALLESENETLRAKNNTTESELDKARRLAAENASSAAQQQEARIRSDVTAADSAVATARQLYRAARESGDIDKETEAQVALSTATAEQNRAKDTQRRFDEWKAKQPKPGTEVPKPAARQSAPQQDGPSAEARQWLANHPLYFADKDYQATALAAHEGAIATLGTAAEGSKAYVDYIEGQMVKAYGANHGQINRSKSVSQPQRRQSSTAAPSRDGGGGNGGDGSFTYRNPGDGSELRLISGVDRTTGKPFETVQGKIPADWREAAKINRMGDVAYAVAQLKIQQEIAEGGPAAGLGMGVSGVYR